MIRRTESGGRLRPLLMGLNYEESNNRPGCIIRLIATTSLKINKQPSINQYLCTSLYAYQHIIITINTIKETHHITTQFLTSQKYSWTCQIWCLTQSPQRDSAFHIGSLRRITHILIVQLRSDRPRQQSIASNSIPPQRHRTRLHQAKHPGLGWRIMSLLPASNKGRDRTDSDY